MQSKPSSPDELRNLLSCLRAESVAAAKFGENGTLLEVSFWPDVPTGNEGKDDDPGETVKNEVEQAQLRLASGAHRSRGNV